MAARGSDAAPSLAVHYERLAFDRQLRGDAELLLYAGAQSAIGSMQAPAWAAFRGTCLTACARPRMPRWCAVEAMRGRPGRRHEALRLSVVARKARAGTALSAPGRVG